MMFIRFLLALRVLAPGIAQRLPVPIARFCSRRLDAGSRLTAMSNNHVLTRWFASFIQPPADEETQLFQQIRKLLNEPRNGDYWPKNSDIRSTRSLCKLLHHHNGYLREKAVLALSLKHDVAALQELLQCTNDWVKQIHHAATQEVLALMTAKNAHAFITHLSQIRQLLTCERYDHSPLVGQICRFLTSEAHVPLLRQALYSSDRDQRHAVLLTLVEQDQLDDEATLGFVLDNGDTWLRSIAVTYWLARAPTMSASLIVRLLRDPWPRIRRVTLFYLDSHGQPLPESLHAPLLLDKNNLIRQRARRMLAGTTDVTAFWRNVFTSTVWSATQRRSALYGLKEVRAPDLHSLARWGYTQPQKVIRQASLHILLALEGEVAKPRMLAALADPCLSFATAAMKLLAHHPLSFSRSELESLLIDSPSDTHTLLYWRLIHQLNKWDWLILLLRHYQQLSLAQYDEQRCVWVSQFNRAGVQPDAHQRGMLAELLPQAPDIHQAISGYLFE